MSAKILVLVVVSSLLGATPPCLCEGHVQTKARPSDCGHCPKEPAGCPLPDCCCVQEGADRASEDQFSVPSAPVALELDLEAAAVPPPSASRPVEETSRSRGMLRRAGPPLYILFQHFII